MACPLFDNASSHHTVRYVRLVCYQVVARCRTHCRVSSQLSCRKAELAGGVPFHGSHNYPTLPPDEEPHALARAPRHPSTRCWRATLSWTPTESFPGYLEWSSTLLGASLSSRCKTPGISVLYVSNLQFGTEPWHAWISCKVSWSK